MQNSELQIYNSLTRQKERFEAINPPFVGLYVCGPTVYSDVHLGNCRTFISFDVIYRYLMYLGYKVRYVRNITDVGHLENDVDIGGEDKVAKKARLEQKEPMEIVQHYTNGFHEIMAKLNTLRPSIEPSATGHIVEQIEMVKDILENGYAYEKAGSVYFDTLKFAKDKEGAYGKLSGKKLDDLLSETRDDLKNQGEKNHPSDFAIWVKAAPEHIMRWPSPWSDGFPGWHLECSVMSTKYLGNFFDIHGGGLDLQFPHHENEIAQNYGACGCQPAKYWLHGNMLEMNGKKMSKSIDPETGLSNSISPYELFSGNSPLISKAYSPMVIRFFMLQTHYRSTLNLTNDALLAADKGYARLMEGNRTLQAMIHDGNESLTDENQQINSLLDQANADMNDDFNTPKALSRLFVLVNKINSIANGKIPISVIASTTLERMKKVFNDFIFEIFGLQDETQFAANGDDVTLDKLMELIIDIRQESRAKKDWGTADKIRDVLNDAKIQLKDGKDGTTWSKN
ncbi:MAG: cysteine--tRNA ligase [Bacteroidota bacterium]